MDKHGTAGAIALCPPPPAYATLMNLWSSAEANPRATAARNRRKQPRIDYRRNDVRVCIRHPGGGRNVVAAVATRDLSAGGMSFLYNNFLYNGTAVDVALRRRLNGEQLVAGHVSWCRHLHGPWHAVGVRFDQPIFLISFVDRAEWERLQVNAPVEPAALRGRMLILDDQEMDHDLLKHLLKNTQIEVATATTLEQAEALVRDFRSPPFDAACVDLNLGVGQPAGEEAFIRLRDAGLKGTIVAMSVDSEARLRATRAMGAQFALPKPIEAARLYAILAAALNTRLGEDQQPIVSSLADAAAGDRHALLDQYINKVQAAANQIKGLILTNDTAQVRARCQTLRATGAGYGFQILSDTAAEAVKAIDASANLAECALELQALQTICQRLSAG